MWSHDYIAPSRHVGDALGWRKKFGVIVPSTNTIVEPDLYAMAVPGVTAHIGRIHIRDMQMGDDKQMENLLEQVRDELECAIQRVRTAEVDYMVMGMSAETFWGGAQGSSEFLRSVETWSGTGVATGAEACRRALDALGVRRIGVITPYQEVGDKNVRRFFGDMGVEVVALEGLRCPSAVAIAHVSEQTLRQALIKVDSPDVEAIVQVGTNLSMVSLADEAERWLGKPVIAINAATWWLALRENGLEDKVYGAGTLLREL